MLDKIKQIKYSRLKEEEKFFLDIIHGIQSFKPFIPTKNSQSVFWIKNNMVLFEQNFEHLFLYVNYELIWSVLTEKYGYTYTQTQSFITNMMRNYTIIEPLTPNTMNERGWKWIKKTYKFNHNN